jgi:putative RecB family exonuclease
MILSELRNKPHLSASSISDFLECGLLYRFSRIDRIKPEFISDAMAFGTCIHRTLKEYYLQKMGGDRMPLAEVQELFQQHWQKYADGNDAIRYSPDKDFEYYLSTGPALLAAWYEGIADDDFEVIAVEEPFRFELPDLPVPVIGAIDLILKDPLGSIVIVDHKAIGRSYSVGEVDSNLQLTVYHTAAKSNGYSDHQILLRFDCMVKTQKPKFQTCYTTRSLDDEQRLTSIARSVWNAIDQSVFVPNPLSFRHKTCAYKSVCDSWFQEGGDL